jgi:PAS domain S-box-containing protein
MTRERLEERTARIANLTKKLMTTPLITMSDTGIIEDANDPAAELFGFDRQDMIGANVKMIMPPEVAEKHDEYLANYLATGKSFVLNEKRVVTGQSKSGDKIPVEISVKEVIAKELGRRTYIGFIRDLRGELAIKYAFNLNDAVTDMTPTPIIALDDRGTVLKFSKNACAAFGYEANEVVGRNVKMLMPEPFASEHDSYLARYAQTGIARVIGTDRRVSCKRKDGTTFPAILRVREFKKQGMNSSFVGFLTDVSDEERMLEEKHVMNVVNQMSNLAVIIIDKRGIVQTVNDATLALFRYSSSEVVGQNIKMLMPRQIAQNHDNYLEAYSRTKQKHIIDTMRRTQAMKKGDIKFEVEIGVRELELDGYGQRFLGFVRDISDEVVLEEASKMSDELLDLSHLPIILISHVGIVMRFSHLAETVFGYKSSEVIGRNVKMLMPESIANQHDEYLERFRRTRVKNVIDATRTTEAKKKSGELFNVELSVKQIKATDGGEYFVGFVRVL